MYVTYVVFFCTALYRFRFVFLFSFFFLFRKELSGSSTSVLVVTTVAVDYLVRFFSRNFVTATLRKRRFWAAGRRG